MQRIFVIAMAELIYMLWCFWYF